MTDKWVIDTQEALFILRRVVFDKGADFVYQRIAVEFEGQGVVKGCYNFHDDQPSCIIGHALDLLGVSADKAKILGVYGAEQATMTVLTLRRVEEFPWTFTAGAEAVFATAQRWQDNGHSWGKALAAAEAVALKN